MLILIYLSCVLFINLANLEIVISQNGVVNTQKLTVLKQFADNLFLQCHESSFFQKDYLTADRLLWMNEKNTFNITDQSILVDLDDVISTSSQLNFQLDTKYSHISCGHLEQGRFFRIKKWQISYIDYPIINLRIRTKPESLYFRRVNESYAQITVPSFSNIYFSNKPLDILKLNCEANFDYPIDKKYIWMYLRNPLTPGIETWYLDESIENSYQFFTKLNDATQELPLSDFLKLILNDNTDRITFQCSSRYEIGNYEPFVLTSSRNLSIAKGIIVFFMKIINFCFLNLKKYI